MPNEQRSAQRNGGVAARSGHADLVGAGVAEADRHESRVTLDDLHFQASGKKLRSNGVRKVFPAMQMRAIRKARYAMSC